jgi:transcriptional regulator with XRE-family HTH domain
MSIGNKLKQKRKEKGFTLHKVAEYVGVDSTSISKFENGTRNPQSSHISKMCKLYGIPEDEMQIIQLTNEIIMVYGENKYVLDALKRASSIIKQKKE